MIPVMKIIIAEAGVRRELWGGLAYLMIQTAAFMVYSNFVVLLEHATISFEKFSPHPDLLFE